MRGTQQNQAGDGFRERGGELGGDGSAVGVTEDDRSGVFIQAEVLCDVADEGG